MTTDKTTTPAHELPGAQPLKDPRVEQFAQLVASGTRRQRECYMIAFPLSQKWKPATLDCRASEMANRPEVRNRINWIKGQAAREAVYELVDHLHSLRAIAAAAMEAGDFNAAARAEEAAGKAAGHVITKLEHTGKGGGPIHTYSTQTIDPSKMSTEMLQALLDARIAHADAG